MRKRCGVLALAAVSLAGLLGASSAAGATEVGNNCLATGGVPGYSFVQLSRGTPSTLPATVPSAGVVTKWSVVSAIELSVTQRLRVFRATGNPNEFTTVGDSQSEVVSPGVNTFETRVPVQANDRLGAAGFGGPLMAPLFCLTENAGDTLGMKPGEAPIGSTNVFEPSPPGYLLAMSGVVEPDGDGDGFGDESQDGCPQSAATQAPCPLTVVDSFALARGKRVIVMVTASAATAVTVSGSAKLPRAAKKKARGSAQAKLRSVTQSVEPGKIVRFALNVPAKLRSAVSALPRGKSLTLKLTATAPNLAGPVTTDRTRLKLKR